MSQSLMLRLFAASLISTVAACGGGGGGGSSPSTQSTPTTTQNNTQTSSVDTTTQKTTNNSIKTIAQADKAAANGSGAYVGMIDTGVNAQGKGISSNTIINSKLLDENSNGSWSLVGVSTPTYYHGTSIAEIISNTANSVSINSFSNTLDDVNEPLRAVIAAKKGGASVDILNQSFSSGNTTTTASTESFYGTEADGYSKLTQSSFGTALKLISQIAQSGTLVVQATGNVQSTLADLLAAAPLAYPELKNSAFLSVTGINASNQNTFRQCGELTKAWCLTAPAAFDLYALGSTKSSYTGTSNAAAYVSGVAANIKSRYDWFTGTDLKNTLISTADDIGASGVDAVYGNGLVNATKALNGYGRFDNDVVLNVDGVKTTYYFDNNITGTGSLTKNGADTLVMNGNNSYTGATYVNEGELILNGNSQSAHTVAKNAILSTGDASSSFNVGSINNNGTLNTTTAGLNISGNLNNAGTINTAIGANINVSGTANLNNSNINLAGVKSGTTISKAGTSFQLLNAGSLNAQNLNFTASNQSVSDLIGASFSLSDQNITVTATRTAIGDVVRDTSNFSGRDKTISRLDGLLDNVDLSKVNSSTSVLPQSTTTTSQAASQLYDYLLNSQNINEDLFTLNTDIAPRSQIQIAALSADRLHTLNQHHIATSEAWISAGKGKTQAGGLDGIHAKSSDNSQFIGWQKTWGKHSLLAQLGNLDYDWNEQFGNSSKNINTKGNSLDLAYRLQQNALQYQLFGSYENLKPKNGSRFSAYHLGLGASYRFDLGKWVIAPYSNLLHTRTGGSDYQLNDSYNLAAQNVKLRQTQLELGTQASYRFGDKAQFALTGDLYARRLLNGHIDYISQTANYQDPISEKLHRTDTGAKLSGSWQISPNIGTNIGIGYEHGNSRNTRQAFIALKMTL